MIVEIGAVAVAAAVGYAIYKHVTVAQVKAEVAEIEAELSPAYVSVEASLKAKLLAIVASIKAKL